MNSAYRLHEFDLLVCDQIHRVVSYHLEDSRFADAMSALDAGLLVTLSSEPPLKCDQLREARVVFKEQELYALQVRIAALPIQLTKHWIWSPAIGRQAVRCVPEINNHFSPLQGRRWDEASANFDGRLRHRCLRLDDAIGIASEWLGLARRYLADLDQPAAGSLQLRQACSPPTVQSPFVAPGTGLLTDVTKATAVDSATAVVTAGSRTQSAGNPSSFLSPPEVAERLRLSPDKVLAWIKSGELVAVNTATKLGGRPRYRISPNSLAEFEKRRITPAKPTPVKQRRRMPGGVVEFFKPETTSLGAAAPLASDRVGRATDARSL